MIIANKRWYSLFDLLPVGNRRLRVLVDANLDRYSACKSKFEKTLVVSSIIDTVRESSKIAGFVKQDPVTKDWTEVRL